MSLWYKVVKNIGKIHKWILSRKPPTTSIFTHCVKFMTSRWRLIWHRCHVCLTFYDYSYGPRTSAVSNHHNRRNLFLPYISFNMAHYDNLARVKDWYCSKIIQPSDRFSTSLETYTYAVSEGVIIIVVIIVIDLIIWLIIVMI